MTIEEKARAYADRYEAKPMAETAIRAYIAGHFEALASQWKDPKVELPEIGELVVAAHIGFVTATYDGEDWYDANDHLIRPTHWLSIPPLKGGEYGM